MGQMKVIVPKLNKRKSPVLDFSDKRNIVGVIKEGEIFESVAQITNALGTWHVNRDGHWVWEMGFFDKDKVGANTQWWFQKLRIDELQNLIAGLPNRPDVTVAILDTGIVNNIDVASVFNSAGSKNFINSTNNIADAKSGHGTLCASLIAASGKIFGSINPQAKVFIGKVFTDMIATNEQIIANAINTLCDPLFEPKIDIISISGGIDDLDPASSVLTAAIHKAQEQSVIISAAVGNRLQTATGYYPALYNYAFSIGALDQNFNYSTSLNPATTKIDYLLPGENIRSINFLESETEFDGTSHACAIMSGILSLVIVIAKSKNLRWVSEDFRHFLDTCCDQVDFGGHIYNRFHPDLLVLNLKNL